MKKEHLKKAAALSMAVMMAAGSLVIPGTTAKAASEVDHSEEITITMMTTEAGTQKFPTEGYVYDVIKEKFNINLEVQPIPASDYDTKISTVLASGQMPDIIGGLQSEKLLKYAPTGMFLNLTEYKDYAPDYFDLMYGEDRAAETKKVESDGSLFGFQKCEYNRIAVAQMVAIRTDLLEEIGVEEPTTFEEYYDDLLKIKENIRICMDSEPEMVPIIWLAPLLMHWAPAVSPTFATTRGMYYEPESDSYVYGPTSEKFTRVVEFLQNAYKDGLLDPDYATMTKDDLFEKASSGKLMSVYDNNSFVGRVYNPALQEIDANAKFDILKPMANEDGNTRSYRYEKDWPNNNSVISVRTKYPERVVELLNWMYTEEGRMITNFGEEGVNYTVDEDGTIVTSQDMIDASGRCK